MIGRVDTNKLLERVDLVDVVGRRIQIRGGGSEYKGICPFHDERTPSFTVNAEKGFVHCFGCEFHADAVGFVMAFDRVDFRTACEILGGRAEATVTGPTPKPRAARNSARPVWLPILPVPDNAPSIAAGQACRIFNPKRADDARRRWWNLTPSRADAYRDGRGRLLGYVLRVEMDDGKITPTVTWCIGPDGERSWCIWPFPKLRPLCGLDELAARPCAPVLVVEGEKCREAGARALPMYVVVCWPGGTNGVRHVDFAALAGRDVVLWPDADQEGRDAMLGRIDPAGVLREGVAQRAWRAGSKSLRLVNTDGQPKGWDIDDALQIDRWTPRQLAAWARSRIVGIDCAVDPQRKAL